MKKILNLVATFAMAALVFAACEPENSTPTPPTPGPGTGTGNGGNENEGGGQTAELKADFTFEVDGLTVQFTNASEGATAYLWNFGDENTATEKDPEHTYDAAGTYTVKLTVQDAAGNAKNVEKEVTVAGAVKAYFTATAKTDRAGKFGKIFTLDASSSENAASIVWDFGDGSESSTEFKVDHEFPEFDQTYIVKATVTGQGGDVDEFEATVEVIGYNELLKGGSMEADDAQFWTVVNHIYADEWTGEGFYGNPLWKYEWGALDGPVGGEGGCLKLNGEGQQQYALKATIYQEIELAAGDQIEISAKIKWDANAVNNGVFFWCVSQDETAFGADETAILEIFNYWTVVAETNPDGTPLPEWEGDLSGAGLPEGAGYAPVEDLVEVTEDGRVIYTSNIDGKAYFGFEIRSVWGAFGYNYYVDEVSAKIIL